MSDAKAEAEPTMEEILSSIRRIISEDDEPPAEESTPVQNEELSVEEILEPEPEPAAEAVPEPEPEPEPEPMPEPEPEPEPEIIEEEILELDQLIEDDGSITDLSGGDMDDDLTFEEALVAPPPPQPSADTSRLISDLAAAESAASLVALRQKVSAERDISVPSHRSLEDITKELLRPMLKEWLDNNLPSIVQRIVEREIAKLAGDVDDPKR